MLISTSAWKRSTTAGSGKYEPCRHNSFWNPENHLHLWITAFTLGRRKKRADPEWSRWAFTQVRTYFFKNGCPVPRQYALHQKLSVLYRNTFLFIVMMLSSWQRTHPLPWWDDSSSHKSCVPTPSNNGHGSQRSGSKNTSNYIPSCLAVWSENYSIIMFSTFQPITSQNKNLRNKEFKTLST